MQQFDCLAHNSLTVLHTRVWLLAHNNLTVLHTRVWLLCMQHFDCPAHKGLTALHTTVWLSCTQGFDCLAYNSLIVLHTRVWLLCMQQFDCLCTQQRDCLVHKSQIFTCKNFKKKNHSEKRKCFSKVSASSHSGNRPYHVCQLIFFYYVLWPICVC